MWQNKKNIYLWHTLLDWTVRRRKKKNQNCEKKILKLKLLQNLKPWVVTRLKSLNCNNTQRLELGQSLTQSLTNFKTQTVTKFSNSNCDKTQQLKLWQTSKI